MNVEQIAARTEKVVGGAEAEHNILMAAVHSSFEPVTHIIKITAL